MLEMMNNEMNVFEEKSVKGTKLVIKNININSESYETKLLSEENIENVIKLQIAYEGENQLLIYDAGDTLSLDEYLRTHKLKKKDICDIMIAIDSVLLSMENYLLPEKSLSLNLKLIRIYKDSGNLKFKFVVIPNHKSDFSYELSKLLIRVLRFIDTNDRDALNLAFGLFVKSSRENYVLSELIELVDKAKRDSDVRSDDYDSDEHRLYDEKLAEEIDESIVYDTNYYNFVDEELNKDVSVKKEKNIDYASDYTILDNRSFDEKASASEDVFIDDDTRDFLDDEIYADFNKEDKKIIKFNKSRRKKQLNAHVNMGFICSIFVPILLVVIPVLYLVMNGSVNFMRNIGIMLGYELVAIVLLVLNKVIKSGDKIYEK